MKQLTTTNEGKAQILSTGLLMSGRELSHGTTSSRTESQSSVSQSVVDGAARSQTSTISEYSVMMESRNTLCAKGLPWSPW
jgi:hypothetical protein